MALFDGYVPITPHLYITQVTNEENPLERRQGMAAGMELLRQCKYILIGDRYGISPGMEEEIWEAKLRGKTFLYERNQKICI